MKDVAQTTKKKMGGGEGYSLSWRRREKKQKQQHASMGCRHQYLVGELVHVLAHKGEVKERCVCVHNLRRQEARQEAEAEGWHWVHERKHA